MHRVGRDEGFGIRRGRPHAETALIVLPRAQRIDLCRQRILIVACAGTGCSARANTGTADHFDAISRGIVALTICSLQ
jgi:hypothetical protein